MLAPGGDTGQTAADDVLRGRRAAVTRTRWCRPPCGSRRCSPTRMSWRAAPCLRAVP